MDDEQPPEPIPARFLPGGEGTYLLHRAINWFGERAQAQTRELIRLTRVLVVLTLVLFLGLVVQIVLALTA